MPFHNSPELTAKHPQKKISVKILLLRSRNVITKFSYPFSAHSILEF